MTVLPERKWELVPVQLNKDEFDVYNRILIFSRTLFAQFLHQRAEKNQDAIDLRYNAAGERKLVTFFPIKFFVDFIYIF